MRRIEVRAAWPWVHLAPRQVRLVSEDWLSLLGDRVFPASFFLVIAIAKLKGLSAFVARGTGHASGLALIGYYAACIHRMAAIAFLGLVVIMFVIRSRPLRRIGNGVQAVVALAGTFAMTLVAMAPQTPTAPVITILAAVIMTAGSLFTAVALLSLGRSFSITPEARGLVTDGIYAFVRHPMYLGEMAGSFGMVLQALSPFTILVFIIFCFFQIRRMDYEEEVLQQVFPDYRIYKVKTARLIPGIY